VRERKRKDGEGERKVMRELGEENGKGKEERDLGEANRLSETPLG